GLPVIDGHLALPDLRIEYETSAGRIEYRDVELETEHYSRGQLAGKARAGFVRYRAGSNGCSRGGTPFDLRHLERVGCPSTTVSGRSSRWDSVSAKPAFWSPSRSTA